MRLYHRTNLIILQSFLVVILSVIASGCTGPQVTQELITIGINVDDKDIQIKTASGSTVQEALKKAQIVLGEMDRVEPPVYTVLSPGSQVRVIRIREEYFIEQKVIPFEHQELINEALPEGERRLSQPGVNGLEEITFHRVFENGIEVSTNVIKSTILNASVPEIVMLGSRSSFASIEIPGKIAFLSTGNAWIIEGTSVNRKLVISTGDLDGRIFKLSKDGKFLLFTRYSNKENSINSLWMASLNTNPAKLFDLGVKDVIHFAEFDPSSTMIAYSTVEWRATAPGWQANNNLYLADISVNGIVGTPKMILETNSGGVYGWWGTEFSWSPDGKSLLYARPDSVGLFNLSTKTMTTLLNISPYQTGGNWAWIPGAAWSPDMKVIYTIDYRSIADSSMDTPREFDLIAIPLIGGAPIRLVENVGMFAFPVPSPVQKSLNFSVDLTGAMMDQEAFSIAILTAIFPDQSETSGYQLTDIDRDGSNVKTLFPEEGAAGLNPQHVAWSPGPINGESAYSIAYIYNGNIWLLDKTNNNATQITGDGLTIQLDWR